MSYIRTKDGHILELTQEIEDDIKDFGWTSILGCLESETKQADSIEELCDAMVVKYSDESFPRVIDMQELLRSCRLTGIKLQEHISFLFERFSKKLEYIVGAIWIGEGNLKAVAKFNKEGELKLL